LEKEADIKNLLTEVKSVNSLLAEARPPH
jgi:hypothetical protein